MAEKGDLCCGTIFPGWFSNSPRAEFKTDYSNASRPTFKPLLPHMETGDLPYIRIPVSCLPKICDLRRHIRKAPAWRAFLMRRSPSAASWGFPRALFGRDALSRNGQTTYEQFIVMMNVGDAPVQQSVWLHHWPGPGGKVPYVLEGKIKLHRLHYLLQKQLGLIEHASETEGPGLKANPRTGRILSLAFTGLGAPYYNSDATALITGFTRERKNPAGKSRPGLHRLPDPGCAVFNDRSLEKEPARHCRPESGRGPTRNRYLMRSSQMFLEYVEGLGMRSFPALCGLYGRIRWLL